MSDAANITAWLQGLPIPWLVGGTVGKADVTSYGTVLDDQVALVKLAVKARMPTEAPSDALPYIASERGLIQGNQFGNSESDADFEVRLQSAWDAWAIAGTPAAVLSQLYFTLGYTDVWIVQQNGVIWGLTTPPAADIVSSVVVYYAPNLVSSLSPVPPATKTIPAGNPWWSFDGNTDFCSRFILIFNSVPASWTSIVSPPTTSSAPSIGEINTLNTIVERWKNAEATFLGTYVIATGLMWGWPASQVWGAGTGNWGGTSIVFDP